MYKKALRSRDVVINLLVTRVCMTRAMLVTIDRSRNALYTYICIYIYEYIDIVYYII